MVEGAHGEVSIGIFELGQLSVSKANELPRLQRSMWVHVY